MKHIDKRKYEYLLEDISLLYRMNEGGYEMGWKWIGGWK